MNATWAHVKCAFQCSPTKSCSSIRDCPAWNKGRLHLQHVRDECSHWWDIHSPRGPLPPAAPQNIPARIGYPLHAPAAQSQQRILGRLKTPVFQSIPKYFGAQGRGKLASSVIPTANSFCPVCSSPFYIPFLTRLCSIPTQHRFQTSNPSLSPSPSAQFLLSKHNEGPDKD